MRRLPWLAALAAGSISARLRRADFSRPNVEAPAYPLTPFRGSAHLSLPRRLTRFGRPL
jgi:hypothetical protein